MFLMMILRLVVLFLFTSVTVLFVILFYTFVPRKYWVYCVRSWANVTVKLAGVKGEAIGDVGNYVGANIMVVANHISWLDIPIIYTQYFVGFIGRSEMKKWPLLNILIKSGGTIFINRKSKRELIHINDTVSKKLIDGAVIGLFPEGKTGDGLDLKPFKPAILEAAIMAKSVIIPLVIRYYGKNGKLTTAVTYEGNITLWQSIKNTLRLNGLKVKVIQLPQVMASNFNNREELAAYLYTQMKNNI